MFRLQACCFCLDLRLSAIVIAGVLLVYDLATISPATYGSSNGVLGVLTQIWSTAFSQAGAQGMIDAVIMMIGIIGSLQNRPNYIRFFVGYFWVRVLVNFLIVITLIILAAIGSEFFVDSCRKMNDQRPSQPVDCRAIAQVIKTILFIAGPASIVISIYIGFVLWSYYKDVVEFPEKYDHSIFYDPEAAVHSQSVRSPRVVIDSAERNSRNRDSSRQSRQSRHSVSRSRTASLKSNNESSSVADVDESSRLLHPAQTFNDVDQRLDSATSPTTSVRSEAHISPSASRYDSVGIRGR